MFRRRKDPTETFMGHLLIFALITPTEYRNREILFLGDLLEKFNGELERKNEIFSHFNHRDVNFEYRFLNYCIKRYNKNNRSTNRATKLFKNICINEKEKYTIIIPTFTYVF